MTFALLLLAAAPAADELFRRGVEARSDARAARSLFAQAAAGYERDEPSPEAWKRAARAHALAGNTPRALRLLHQVLSATPHDRDAQHDLEAVRDAVPYPAPSAPDAVLRPAPPSGPRYRLAPGDLFMTAVGCAGLAAVGLAARLTTRPGWSTVVLIVGGAGFVLSAGLATAVEVSRRWADDAPRIVSAQSAVLRRGNGDSYPPRLAERLPRGTEVAELHRRGGWTQVRVAGGAVGWLPDAALLR